MRCLPGRIKSECDSHACRDCERRDNRWYRGLDRPSKQIPDKHRGVSAQQDPDQAAEKTQRDRFNQELPKEECGAIVFIFADFRRGTVSDPNLDQQWPQEVFLLKPDGPRLNSVRLSLRSGNRRLDGS